MCSQNHKIYLGENAREHILDIFNHYAHNDVLLICGKHSFEKSGSRAFLAPFLKDKNVTIFSDFSSNPNISDIAKLVALIESSRPSILLAVGGGSAMDVAKAAKGLSFLDMPLEQAVQQNIVNQENNTPLLTIPTTSGTGSEATHFAVVYVGDKKYSLAHPILLPEYVIVDPVFSYNMPDYLRACTGMDALSQAIESFWAVGATHTSQTFSAKALKLIKSHFLDSFQPDMHARAQMAIAAYYSGCAINISKTTAAHALSYHLTSQYGIPHGHAVAINLPKFVLAHSEEQSPTLSNGVSSTKHHNNMQMLCETLDFQTPKALAVWFVELMQAIKLPFKWRELELQPTQIANELVNHCNFERMTNNPVKFLPEQLVQIIKNDTFS